MDTIKQHFVDDNGVFHLVSSQDGDATAQGVKEHAQRMAKSKEDGVQYLGSLPLLACQVMAKESGTKIGTREFTDYATKKLKSGDWAAFAVRTHK